MRESPRDRFLRVLAVLSWAVRNPGSEVEVLCQRFGVSRKQLLRDLEELVPFCGLPPYSPDRLIDVVIDNDRVEVRFGEYFGDPIALTPRELLGVVLALEAFQAVDTDNAATLSALEKLRHHSSVHLETDFAANTEIARTVSTGLAERRLLHLNYFSHSRNAFSDRTVEPKEQFWANGNWYLAAHCRTANAARFFRFDRIHQITLGSVSAEFLDTDNPPPTSSDAVRQIEVLGDAETGHVLEQEYAAVRTPNSEYSWQVAIHSELSWERLSLRFGSRIRAVEHADQRAAGVAARRVRDRYVEHARLPE